MNAMIGECIYFTGKVWKKSLRNGCVYLIFVCRLHRIAFGERHNRCFKHGATTID